MTVREALFSKGTLGHLAVQGQAGLGSAPVECTARMCTGVSDMHSCLPLLAALKRLGFGLTPGLVGDYSFYSPFPLY